MGAELTLANGVDAVRRRRQAHQSGITLIELLIVLAIMALASGIVVLTAAPREDLERKRAQRFAIGLEAAFDDAIVTGRVYRLIVGANGYRIERLDEGEWNVTAASRPDDIANSPPLRFETADPAKSNALGLYGGEDEAGRGNQTDETTAALDPFGVTPEFVVAFQGAQRTWLVRNSSEGVVTVTQAQ